MSILTAFRELLGKRPVTITVRSLLTPGDIRLLVDEYIRGDMVDSVGLIIIAKQRNGDLQMACAGEAKKDDILALHMLLHAGDMVISGEDGNSERKLEETEGD